MILKKIYIRKETYENEYRTPLTPNDVCTLVKSGFEVCLQTSLTRIYSDKEYELAGATITPYPWNFPYFKSHLILGIKEVENLQILDEHSHAYFSHSFKQQKHSEILLATFFCTKSKLYDFEYFLGSAGERVISFGFYAGVVGAVLGLLEHSQKLTTSLLPWNSFEAMLHPITSLPIPETPLHIGVIGSNGRCGIGVLFILRVLNLPFTILDRDSDISTFNTFDIFFNCIKLQESYDKVWFNRETEIIKKITIVDISCDSSKVNNPIQLYPSNTSWNAPVYSYSDLVKIIAIDNLPSLLPKESSDYFSSLLVKLFLHEDSAIWEKALSIFYQKCKSLRGLRDNLTLI